MSCFWRDLGHLESIIKDASKKKWKAIQDPGQLQSHQCQSSLYKCLNLSLSDGSGNTEHVKKKKKRSVVMWLFYFFESYILWESFCHPSYSKTVLNSCCGCEWQLNVRCVEEKTGRNSCSKSGLSCAQGQPYRTASSNNSNLRWFSVNIHPNLSEWNEFDYLELWHPMEKSKAYCAVIVRRQIYHKNTLPLYLPSWNWPWTALINFHSL